MNKRVIWAIACLVALAVAQINTPSVAKACSCADIGTTPEAIKSQLERSSVVFSGKVIAQKMYLSPEGRLSRAMLFEVTSAWKGATQSQVIVHTGNGGGDCGFIFRNGHEYLVYAYDWTEDGDIGTNICSGTEFLKVAADDLKVHGPGQPPTERVNLAATFAAIKEVPCEQTNGLVDCVKPDPGNSGLWLGLLVMGAITGFAVIVGRLRRRAIQ